MQSSVFRPSLFFPLSHSSTLTETLRNMDLSTLLPFQRGQPENFAQFLDKAVGFV